jgi:2-dehydro-3-deoxy-D-arabinonate dehydratase
MLICRVAVETGHPVVGVVLDGVVHNSGFPSITAMIGALERDRQAALSRLAGQSGSPGLAAWDALQHEQAGSVRLLAPLDEQEVWAAGVTYLRSAQAREGESNQSGIYDRVYAAERPELFFKAMASRVVGPGGTVCIRNDSHWNVPEPELVLVIGPRGSVVGYTAGNDVSSRDIEGANPLYLPQAKVYTNCCALGPAILVAEDHLDAQTMPIHLEILRGGARVFQGESSTARMKRTLADLVRYLYTDNAFPQGAFLLTGTGIVPGDDFSLQEGDTVTITIPAIGTLRNTVARVPQATLAS